MDSATSKQLVSYFRTVIGEDLVGGGRGSIEETGPEFMEVGELGNGRGSGCDGGRGLMMIVGKVVGTVYGKWRRSLVIEPSERNPNSL